MPNDRNLANYPLPLTLVNW